MAHLESHSHWDTTGHPHGGTTDDMDMGSDLGSSLSPALITNCQPVGGSSLSKPPFPYL